MQPLIDILILISGASLCFEFASFHKKDYKKGVLFCAISYTTLFIAWLMLITKTIYELLQL